MPPSTRLEQLREASSLPDWLVPYVAGLVDAHASIVVSVARDSNRSIGFRPKQELRYKGDKRAVFDIFERYCREQGIEPRIAEQSGTTYPHFQLTLSARSDIVDFLEPLRPYLVVRDRAVTLLLETLIPGLEQGAHSDRTSFLAWLAVLDEYRQEFVRSPRATYDYEYFRDEWDVDPVDDPATAYEWFDPPVESGSGGTDDTATESTTEAAQVETESGPEWIEPYVAALVDAEFDFVISVGEQETRAIGYKITHRLKYNAREAAVMRLLREYLQSLNVAPRIQENDGTAHEHYEVIISRRDDIVTLLETIEQYVVAREEAVRILLEEIIPALNAGAHSTRASFVDLMGDIDAFREVAGRGGRTTYDQEYFESEWELEGN